MRFQVVVLIASIVIAEAMHRSRVLEPIEHLYSDLWHRVSGARFAPAHTALVVVDDVTLAEHSETPMVFWTPLFARAAATLRDIGATVIGVDFLFAITPEEWISRQQLSGAEGLREYDLAFRQELNMGRMVVAGAVIRGAGGAADDGLLLPHTDYLLSMPEADFISHVGFADLVSDSDGGIRNYTIAPPLNLPADIAEGAPRFTLGALLAGRAASLERDAAAWQIGGREVGIHEVRAISYAGPPGTLPRVSMSKVLAAGATSDPAVLGLRGKVVIIGADHQGMNDVHTTPYSAGLFAGKSLMAGAEIQANIVETLLSGRDTRPVPDWLRFTLLATLIGVTSWAYRRLTPWTGLVLLLGALAVNLVIAVAAFQQFWLVPAATIQAGLAAAYLLTFSERLTSEERDKARVKKMFKGYVSDSVVDMLLSSEKKLELDGELMRITILFSDIRHFTTITERLSARETVEFLNAYFRRVVDVIFEEGGRIDKFIGDAVMAEFGVPYAFPDHAHRALRAAVRIRAVAAEFDGWMQERFADRGIPQFQIGVGVHTGEAVVGNIGSETRMEYTAIGDTVNVASRLEGETKGLHCVIAASGETVRAAGGRVSTGRRESIQVKGRVEPVEVHEIIDVA